MQQQTNTSGTKSGTADIGVVGLGVMGRSLALNLAGKGYAVAGFDPAAPAVGDIDRAASIPELLAILKPPRRVLCMVPAGKATDDVLSVLFDILEAEDIIIDGGNSHFADTDKRAQVAKGRNIRYIGLGVSGGEDGARKGPSLMPGTDPETYAMVEGLLTAIAARAPDGRPCVALMGPRGAGHYVKMVHNGIEYADMQLIAESYEALKSIQGMETDQTAAVFETWSDGPLESYLIDITVRILRTIDPETDRPLIDLVLDQAAHKGTGSWVVKDALNLGVPIPTIAAALEARAISNALHDRVSIGSAWRGQTVPQGTQVDKTVFPRELGEALYAARIIAYAQGFSLLEAADAAHSYGFRPADIAHVWRAGCIIRSRLLDPLAEILASRHATGSSGTAAAIMSSSACASALGTGIPALRKVVSAAVTAGVPMPAMSATIAYFDSLRVARLPTSLVQAQRDSFGAHTYRRTDRPGNFHSTWG